MEKPEFIKYESIAPIDKVMDIKDFLERHSLNVFEKIDGGNCQVSNFNYQLLPGNRSNFLQGQIIRKRKWFGDFVEWAYSNPPLFNLPSELIVFGEWTAEHTIDYDREHSNQFFMIDLFDRNIRSFVPYNEAVRTLEDLGVSGVKFLEVLAEGKVSPETIKRLLITEPSNFYDGPKEGLVIKDYSRQQQQFAKILHPNFDEKRNLKLGDSRKTKKGSESELNYSPQEYPIGSYIPPYLVHQRDLEGEGLCDYLTAARCRKAGLRLLDEGRKNISYDEMVREIIRDVYAERRVVLDYRQVKDIVRQHKRAGELSKIAPHIKS